MKAVLTWGGKSGKGEEVRMGKFSLWNVVGEIAEGEEEEEKEEEEEEEEGEVAEE